MCGPLCFCVCVNIVSVCGDAKIIAVRALSLCGSQRQGESRDQSVKNHNLSEMAVPTHGSSGPRASWQKTACMQWPP